MCWLRPGNLSLRSFANDNTVRTVHRKHAPGVRAVGLPEMVVEDQDDYFELAFALATDTARFEKLREKLAHNRLSAPLFDVKTYTLALESLYARMRGRYRLGLSPATV